MARRRTVEEAHRCGYLLTDARRTADRRAGGFRGVLERSGIACRTAYRLIELDERCLEVCHVAHFTSVRQHARQTGRLPSTRWFDDNPCSYCDCTPVTHDDQDRPYAWTRSPMGDKRWRCEAEGDA